MTDGVAVGVVVAVETRDLGEAVGVGVAVGVGDGVDHSISLSSERVDSLTVPELVVVDVRADVEVENADDVELKADVTVLLGVGVG